MAGSVVAVEVLSTVVRLEIQTAASACDAQSFRLLCGRTERSLGLPSIKECGVSCKRLHAAILAAHPLSFRDLEPHVSFTKYT